MSGNPDQASVWDDCDIFVAFDTGTANPATIDDDFGVGWERVGLLDGTAGVDENVDEPRGTHRAWGAGVIKTTYQGAEVTRAFAVLEDNETIERLARPNLRERVKIAFEFREGERVRREIARKPATVRRNGTRKRSEDALTALPLMATLYPDLTVDPDPGADDLDQFIEVQTTEDSGS